MFCTQCGATIPVNGGFCQMCGKPVKAAAPNPSAPPPVPAQPREPATGPSGEIRATPLIPTEPVAPHGAAKCAWCGEVIDVSSTSTTCPKCGATLNAAAVKTRSGWAKLPGRKDMAKLQFGNSVCQIEGAYVPVADLNLAAEDSIYFTHHVLLWKDPQVSVSAMTLKGGWQRLWGGLPLIMTQAQGPGHIAFSQDSPGEVIAMPLQHGQEIDVREHLFLAATGNVAYDWYQSNIWFQTRRGNDTETRYPVGRVVDRFSATGAPGLLLLHAAGNVFVRQLAPGQTILIKPTALVFKDPSVQMELYYERPASMITSLFFSTNSGGYMWLRLYGPGRVAIQSVFDRIEGEGANISSSSGSSLISPNALLGGLAGGILGSLLESALDSSDRGSGDWGSSDSGSSGDDSGGSGGDWN